MDPITTFSGLATGIDTASIVTQLVQVERIPITRLQGTQGNLRSISQRVGNMVSLMDAMKEKAEALDSREESLPSAVTSSDEDSVGVTATGGASLGSFAVSVSQLATAERTYSDGVAAKDQTGLFNTGRLRIRVGSDPWTDIMVDNSSTMESIVSDINSSGLDVTAGILFDGTNYRISVTGNNTGAANDIDFRENWGLQIGLDKAANEVVTAEDAAFTVDGFAMTRENNTVVDAIPGVELDLKAVTSSDVTVNISRDSEALETNVQEFLDAYNAVMSAINAEFTFSGEARVGDSLSGDSTLRGLQSRLRVLTSSEITGLSSNYATLRSVGISSNSDGTLDLDSEELASALADDPEAVSALFRDDTFSGIEGFMPQFAALVDEYTDSTDGLLSTKIDGIGDRIDDIDDQIGRMELNVEAYEARLRAQFTAMEQLVGSLQAQGQQMLAVLGSSNSS